MYSAHHSFCCIRQIQRKSKKKGGVAIKRSLPFHPSFQDSLSRVIFFFFSKLQHRVFFLFPEQRRWTFFLFFIQTRLWTTFSSINKLFSNFTFPFGYLPFCWHSVYISRIRPQCFFFSCGICSKLSLLITDQASSSFFFFYLSLNQQQQKTTTSFLVVFFFFVSSAFNEYSRFVLFFFLRLLFPFFFFFSSLSPFLPYLRFFFLFRCLFRCPLLFPLLFFFSFSVNVVTVTRGKKKKNSHRYYDNHYLYIVFNFARFFFPPSFSIPPLFFSTSAVFPFLSLSLSILLTFFFFWNLSFVFVSALIRSLRFFF